MQSRIKVLEIPNRIYEMGSVLDDCRRKKRRETLVDERNIIDERAWQLRSPHGYAIHGDEGGDMDGDRGGDSDSYW
ncbi:uncharacterized protein DS421_15g520260 [Arachis hypogaea]|nr:uncharacterized protein DS421_15g520260 [Arachis hypogaea]